jgi:hypothetical protein
MNYAPLKVRRGSLYGNRDCNGAYLCNNAMTARNIARLTFLTPLERKHEAADRVHGFQS